jgi:hypothetical protein
MAKKKRDLLTPYVSGDFDLVAGSKGLTFRKQILPITTINYEGRKVAFDLSLHKKVLSAFKDRAYDQVPLVLATKDNEHNELAENYRASMTDLELVEKGDNPGLYGTFSFPSRRAAKAVLMNTDLGVSCRLREQVEKADGRKYEVALRHVCATLDPRVTGMSPWEKVDLSGYSNGHNVLDLTSVGYDKEGSMPKTKSKTRTGSELDLSELRTQLESLNDEQQTELLSGMLGLDLSAPADVEDDEDEDDVEDAEDELSSEDEDSEDESEGEGEDEDDEGESDLSDSAQRSIDLANAAASQATERANTALDQLADERWRNERAMLLGRGVPAAVVDLAEPFLHSRDEYTLDLTNGKTLNAAKRIRKILEATAGFIDLDGARGHGVDLTEDDAAKEKDNTVLKAWNESGYKG